jgi:hypothetical protein
MSSSFPIDASIFALREVTRVREIDEEIELALQHSSPQALLRDLHRSTRSFGVNPIEFPTFERIIDGGRGAIAELKQDLRASYRVPIQELIPTQSMLSASIAERRQVMRSPWADAPRFGKQYLPAGMGAASFW